MEIEAEAVLAASARLDNSLLNAVDLISGPRRQSGGYGHGEVRLRRPAKSPPLCKARARPLFFCTLPKPAMAT